MHRKPIQELLTHTAIFAEFNKPLLDQVIGQLNAFNLIVIFSNNEKIENAEVEKYLGAKYAIQPLPERVPSSLSFNKLNVNEYLPIDITVHPVVELNSED